MCLKKHISHARTTGDFEAKYLHESEWIERKTSSNFSRSSRDTQLTPGWVNVATVRVTQAEDIEPKPREGRARAEWLRAFLQGSVPSAPRGATTGSLAGCRCADGFE